MAEINLNDLPLEPVGAVAVDFDNYADPQEFAPPIPEGNYRLKTTEVKVENYDGQTGVVSFLLNHEAYDAQGTKVGTLNFDRISTKVFNRNNVPASMAADQIRACGFTDRPVAPRQWAELIQSIKSWCDQGNTWDGVVKWDGYCSHDGTDKETVFDQPKNADGKRPKGSKPLPAQPAGHFAPWTPRGMKNWPLIGTNGSAEHAAVVPCPTCGKEVQARAKIDRRIPKS